MSQPTRLAVLLTALLLPVRLAAQSHDHEGSAPDETGPRFSLRGFADVDFSGVGGASQPGEPKERSAFAFGQFDLYMVSRLTDKIRFLGETVFELDENQEAVVDVERLQIGYHWSDAFHLTAGRGHTALGYWNEAYHHGKLLQPTVERPEALKFEDDGGVLPVHFVGLEAGGRRAFGAWDLSYVAFVANGRGTAMPVIQGAFDANSNKAVGGKLSLSREGKHGFSLGPSIYHDVIPADPGQPDRGFEIRETIVGAHLVYRSARVDVFSEYFHISHEGRETETAQHFSHDAAYAVGVLHFGSWSPYAGIDWLDLDAADPFYPPPYASVTRVLLGVRWDIVTFNCLKLEYGRSDRPWGVEHAVVLQSAFTF
jgi:hypothetical protein